MSVGRLQGVNLDADLYETDFVGWTEQQARLLRAAAAQRTNLALDWDHLAEEVEDLGKSYRRALASHVGTVIEHLLKLECSPAQDPRRGWLGSVRRARTEIESWLADEPGLRPRLPGIVAEQMPRTARLVTGLLRDAGEPAEGVTARLQAGGYSVEQITGDWLPPEPAP